MTIHCVLVVFEGIFVRKRNSLSLWCFRPDDCKDDYLIVKGISYLRELGVYNEN